MQLPNPPWYRRWSVILAGVIGLAAIAAFLGVRGLQSAEPSTTSAGQAPPTTVVDLTSTVPPTTTPPPTSTTQQPGVVWSKQGHDVDKSPGIRTPANWRIEWSFNCASFKKYGGGGFKITGDGAFEEVLIQEQDIKASGSRTYNHGGYGHLSVTSVCEHWTVTVLRA
jgi:hypothetical protein